jgi:hypothetical protein
MQGYILFIFMMFYIYIFFLELWDMFMSTLYCGGGSRNISCMPRCWFNVLNVHLQ